MQYEAPGTSGYKNTGLVFKVNLLKWLVCSAVILDLNFCKRGYRTLFGGISVDFP